MLASLIGTPLAELDTPCLLVDLDALDRNLRRMADLAAAAGVALRPHVKSHKTPMVARKQIELGAVGVTCAKLGEAEAMAAGGVLDLLISSEIVGPLKIARLVALASRARVIVVVDDPDNVRELSAAATAAGVEIGVLVELNVGQERCGVLPGTPALELAEAVARLPGLRFRGLQGYEGHLQSVRSHAEREARNDAAMRALTETRRLIEGSGRPVEIVSTAGTGTSALAAAHDGVTELQPGSYVFMDSTYSQVEGLPFENALSVLTSVVSRQRPGAAIVDAGWKSLTVEQGIPLVKGNRGLVYAPAGDEHGRLTAPEGAPLPALGEKIEMLPSHCDTTVNLYDRFICLRGGRVETVWAIAARGASR